MFARFNYVGVMIYVMGEMPRSPPARFEGGSRGAKMSLMF